MVSAAVVVATLWMAIEARDGTKSPRARDVDAGVAAASAKPAEPAAVVDAGPAEDLDAGLSLTAPSLGDAAMLAPTGGPRTVKLGVVLVAFQGAEGAPASARSKHEALSIAERLGQDARSDFHHAVTGGDSGSADDIGRLPRGVLDAHTEMAVFALAPGEISDVLETPKGYWIVKRIE